MDKREQLAELDWSQLQEIICYFFVSDTRTWQAEILDEITDDETIYLLVRDMIIDKICKEVTCKELQEIGYDITEHIEDAA